MTIIEALSDPQLFGALPAFQSLTTWTRWLVFLKAVYGLALTAEEVAIFKYHTRRTVYDPPDGGWPEAAAIVGRQSGKTRIAGLIVGHEAAMAESVRDGTDLYGLLIAQDHRGAMRSVFSYAKAPFDLVPMLASQVLTQTADTVKLANNVTVAAYPCRPASVRGLRAQIVVLDELAYFRSSENLPVDVEMLRAVRPCLATTGGKLIILSSPYGQSGSLWELHRQYFGKDGSYAGCC